MITHNQTNCWQFTACGREPGGSRVHELGVCPAAIAKNCNGIHLGRNGGRACWAISGTLCDGKLQGTIASKFRNCLRCAFYQQVKAESQGSFLGTDQILALISANGVSTLEGDDSAGERQFTVLTNTMTSAPDLRASLRQFLERKTLRVVEAASLEETDALSARTRPALLLLTVTQEELHGNSTSGAIQRLTQANAPIIFITERDSLASQRQGFKLGALGVLHTEAGNFWEELDQKVERVMRLKLRMNGLFALLLDSDAASNRVITACLQQQGVTVLLAKDEAEAKAIVTSQQTIDLVISEGADSPVNGIALCRYLRTLPRFATTPIILLFPEGARERVLDFVQAGATDYLIKPYPREELLARLLIISSPDRGSGS